MCEVGAKTANVARHALVNALQICETEKIKKITRGRRNSNQLGGSGKGVGLLVYIRAIWCSLSICLGSCLCHIRLSYSSHLGEICIRNHFKCFRLNTQINRKGFPMNAYECVLQRLPFPSLSPLSSAVLLFANPC